MHFGMLVTLARKVHSCRIACVRIQVTDFSRLYTCETTLHYHSVS
jgi:hypothetical protein